MLEKYGDIYGRERIAELLGMDLASLDVSAMTHEKKPQIDPSMFTWYRKMQNTLISVTKMSTANTSNKNDSIPQKQICHYGNYS